MAIGLFPCLAILEALTSISLGDAFHFLQCIILLKSQVLNLNNGYEHFNILLNSFFSQFITHGTILGVGILGLVECIGPRAQPEDTS